MKTQLFCKLKLPPVWERMKESKLPHHIHLHVLNLGKPAQLLTYLKEENPEQILKSAILSTFVEFELIASWLHLIFFFPE